MSNNKQIMGDMQFNGTPEEWEALVKKNKMSNNKSGIEWLINDYFGGIENCSPMFRSKIEQAKEMEIAGKEMSYAEGYAEGYKRALELIEWMIKTEIKRNNEPKESRRSGN